eukprot:1195741-Prorocentrum_minimum.AAC.5
MILAQSQNPMIAAPSGGGGGGGGSIPGFPSSQAPYSRFPPGPHEHPQQSHVVAHNVQPNPSASASAPQPANQSVAQNPVLKCLDCTRNIPCSCPLANRLAIFPNCVYHEALMINKLGETCQLLWELSAPLRLDALEELTRRVCKVVQYAVESVEQNAQGNNMALNM